jgi:anaerobic selenocysteine-containing dehydrogenase
LRLTIERHGPESIGTYMGSGAQSTATALAMMPVFRSALGSSAGFSNVTIDQSAKSIAAGRLGFWAAGRQTADEADVMMLFGANPLVSLSTLGFFISNPLRQLKAARARGLKLIVIDPRSTETARYADIHLQALPGEDATIAAGMIRIILAEGWQDRAFCEAYVAPGHMARIEAAVGAFTPDRVAERAGISAEALFEATRLFATARKGACCTSTGPDMSPDSNVAEHLIESLNVICGRYKRAGDKVRAIAPWTRWPLPVAMALSPTRPWQTIPAGRIRGAGGLQGERFTGNLADEILTPGPGQIRVLINDGGNPATAVPDQRKVVRAFRMLDLMVSIEPFMTNSARLSHYVFPPKMMYERPDLPFALPGVTFNFEPFAQYASAAVAPPPGSEVIDDWYFYWGVAKRLGLQLIFAGKPLGMHSPPTSEELLERLCADSLVPLDEIRKHPQGKLYDVQMTVQPAGAAAGRFELLADDVAEELRHVAARLGAVSRAGQAGFPFLLAARRHRDFMNSVGTFLPAIRKRHPRNDLLVNPADLAMAGLMEGETVDVVSDTGRITAIVVSDASLRRGVVSLLHGFGGLPEDSDSESGYGANVNALISTDRDVEAINSMPRMSAIPVAIVRRAPTRAQGH